MINRVYKFTSLIVQIKLNHTLSPALFLRFVYIPHSSDKTDDFEDVILIRECSLHPS